MEKAYSRATPEERRLFIAETNSRLLREPSFFIRNPYPYDVGPGIEHWTLWYRDGINPYEEYKKYTSLPAVVKVNEPEFRSIPEIDHAHVFLNVFPLSYEHIVDFAHAGKIPPRRVEVDMWWRHVPLITEAEHDRYIRGRLNLQNQVLMPNIFPFNVGPDVEQYVLWYKNGVEPDIWDFLPENYSTRTMIVNTSGVTWDASGKAVTSHGYNHAYIFLHRPELSRTPKTPKNFYHGTYVKSLDSILNARVGSMKGFLLTEFSADILLRKSGVDRPGKRFTHQYNGLYFSPKFDDDPDLSPAYELAFVVSPGIVRQTTNWHYNFADIYGRFINGITTRDPDQIGDSDVGACELVLHDSLWIGNVDYIVFPKASVEQLSHGIAGIPVFRKFQTFPLADRPLKLVPDMPDTTPLTERHLELLRLAENRGVRNDPY